jgi:hypothetical protein
MIWDYQMSKYAVRLEEARKIRANSKISDHVDKFF